MNEEEISEQGIFRLHVCVDHNALFDFFVFEFSWQVFAITVDNWYDLVPF
jgi:hypothetical protein